jgi:alanine racemase
VGESLGYGHRFTASQKTQIGIVACGYADGYPRHAPNGTPIAVAGKLTQTLGRVSMDMLFVDITAISEAEIGTSVEMWGNIVSVDDVAHSAGTISYELLCAVAPRVPVKVIA